ncbi:MAG: ABC transporter substrate-binding protein [Acidimicrobiia bacterium]|nr:ABC transporter substrate-binding protein [Acidimicrobiia bacterium]
MGAAPPGRRHRRPSSPVAVVVAVAVVTLLAAACGGGGGGDDGNAGGPASSVDSRTTEPPTTEPSAEPQPGGELVVATIFDLFGLEPATFVGSITDGLMALALYDPLMTFDPATGEPVPWLAESMESDDGRTWTITLRPAVQFQDGTPLDAAAVKVNLERHADPELRSRSITSAQHIEAIETPDPLTVVVRLRDVWPAFPEVLAGSLGLMASPAAIAAGTVGEQPVGTGPFRLVEWIPGDHLTVERNPGYWRPGEPYLDRIVFRPIPDTVTRFESVKRGEVHLGQTTSGAELVRATEAGLQDLGIRRGQAITLFMNTAKPPFDDVRVRRALHLATDTDTINRVIFDDSAPPAFDGIVDRDSPYADHDAPWLTFDADAAATLVDEVVAEKGPDAVTFTYQCHTQPDLVNMAAVLEQMWEDAGFSVEVETQDQISVVVDVMGGSYQASCFGTGAAHDPDLNFFTQLHSGSNSNWTAYSDPEVDEALVTGRTSTDEQTRREAYSLVQEHLAADVPLFVLNATPWGYMGRPEVHGVGMMQNAIFQPSVVWLER